METQQPMNVKKTHQTYSMPPAVKELDSASTTLKEIREKIPCRIRMTQF
jgi:hypothetical protein